MKKIIQTSAIAIILSLFCFYSIIPVLAQEKILKGEKQTDFNRTTNTFANRSGYTQATSLEDMIATVIKMVLATLGTIFIVLMFVAGNTWMQAAGNEEKIKKSKARIQSLIIGLIITLLAYALSNGFSSLLASALLQ